MKSSALKKLTAAVASALVLTSAAHAAGLGKLTVLSALGQPLRAEIELTAVSGDEASGLSAKLASPEAFKAANIDFNPALLSLRFTVEQRGGRQFIRVSSTQPLNEPFVDMLLELSWNNGRLVREYTFLLDPAELRATQSAQVAPSETRAAPAARPQAAAPSTAEAARPQETDRGTARAPRRSERAAAEGDENAASKYRVKPGETLGRIAAQVKPVDVSLDMMLVALYRANPDAFIGNNMNRLKSGRILTVPAGDAVRGTDAAEAHGVVVAHAADFNAYRNKLAGQVGASEPAKAPEAGQGAAGKITAKVEERPTAANEAQDKLRLSKAAPAQPAGKGTTMSTEDRIAKEKELADAQSRVRELERNVSDLEKLATVKNKAGAEAAKNASTPPAAPVAQPQAPTAAATHAPAAPTKLPTIKPAVKPAAAPPEPGLMDFIMNNLPLVGGAAAALLLGGLLVAQRRKKQVVKTVAEPSVLGVPTEPAHSMFAETGGQSVDTNNSVFNSSFAPSASQLDTNEVDPVAEADVYIAYGRDAQAEEILKEALRTHPERAPVRLKLLEIYAARKDLRAFETQATELYATTRGQGDEWAQAAALGLSIDPMNPLYATSAAPAAPVHSTEELGQQTMLSKELDDDAFRASAAHEADPFATQPAAAMDFGQHFADAMATAQPAPAPVTNAPSPTPVPTEDDHVLDFDLGGLAFEPVEAAAAPAPAAPVAEANDVPDFDFDMSAFEKPAAPAPAPAEPVEAIEAVESVEPAVALDKAGHDPLDFAFDMDFAAPAPNPVPELEAHTDHDLLAPTAAPAAVPTAAADIEMASLAREFDLPDLPTELQASLPAEPAASAAPEARDPLFDLDAMDFGLPETPHADSPASIPTAALDDHLFDIPATPAPAEATFAEPDRIVIEPVTEPVVPQFDMGGFDLDLPADGSLPLPEVQSLSEPEFAAPAADAAPAGALSPAHMEMETKLDLAIAYQEIGDKEGARELLEEVIRGGNPEQAARANSMRATLA